MTIWKKAVGSFKYGVVVYHFKMKGDHLLPLTVGDTVVIVEETGDWYRGYNPKSKTNVGLFPKSYVHLRDATLVKSGSLETVIPKEPTISQEITSVVREWYLYWKNLYVEGDQEFETVQQMIHDLLVWRKEIMSRKVTTEQMKDLKQKISSKIDSGNALLGLDLVVRDEEGNVLTSDTASLIKIYREHCEVADRIKQEKQDHQQVEPKASVGVTYNLYVMLRNFVCRVDDVEILVNLYDAKTCNYICENYIVKWERDRISKDPDILSNLRVVFTDLDAKDREREKVYLVLQIVRFGVMDHKDAEDKKQTKGLRRPFGAAAMDITEWLQGSGNTPGSEDTQHFVPFLQCGDKESMESCVKKTVTVREINHKGQGLWVSLKLLKGDIKQIREDLPHLVQPSTTVVRKMGFPDVIMPGDVRNDIYITIIEGEFNRGSKTADKNVEVTMLVCNKQGEPLTGVINPGCGCEGSSEYKTIIYYHEDRPKWYEIVKVAVSTELEFKGLHLKFLFKHKSRSETKDKNEKPFAMAFIKLLNKNGTTLMDKEHDLLLYKIDHRQKEERKMFNAYLDLPSTIMELEATNSTHGTGQFSASAGGTHSRLPKIPLFCGPYSLSYKDSFKIKTYVCSTKLTHNVDLLGLLRWQEVMSDQTLLKRHLEHLMRVDGEEIVKFLQDLLDSLFYILMHNTVSDLYDNLVFDALVNIIGLVAESRYYHFRPILDAYIQSFSLTTAYNKLMVILKEYIDQANEDTEHEPSFRQAMKSLEYIFKFIIRSRELFAMLNENRGRQQFEIMLKQLIESIGGLMLHTSDRTVRAQGYALRNMPLCITDILKVFNAVELSHLFVNFLNHVPKQRLRIQKIKCIEDLVSTELFQRPECREVLLPMMLSTIHNMMEAQDEMTACIKVLSNIMDTLFTPTKQIYHDKDIDTLMEKILRTVIQTTIRTHAMGRKRRNRKLSHSDLGKKRKIDDNNETKKSQDVSKENNYVGTFRWVKLQGLKVMWPVLVKSLAHDKMLVYVKSDNDHIYIRNDKSTQPFPGNFESLKDNGIAYLQSKKLWDTLDCLKADIDWAITEHVCNSDGEKSNDDKNDDDDMKREYGISQDKSKPNRTVESTRSEDNESTEIESPHAENFFCGDNSSTDKDYVQDLCGNTSDKNSDGEERNDDKDNDNDDVKGVGILQDKSKPNNSTGESTRYEDDERTKTDSPDADDNNRSDNSSADKDYVQDLCDNTNGEHFNGEESNDDIDNVKKVRIFQDKSKPNNSTGESTRFEDDKRTKTESLHADDHYFSDESSADKDYVQDLCDNTSGEHFKGEESNDDIDNVKKVRIFQDKSKPNNSTGESTRYEDDERTKTESPDADDNYCSDNSSADKDYVQDLCDNTSGEHFKGEESNDDIDNVKKVRIFQDKSKPNNSTGESTRYEDDERTKTESPDADDNYCSDNSSTDKDYVQDLCDNTRGEHFNGEESNHHDDDDEVKRVRISEDKSNLNSTGESTRYEDDERTETESPHADDDYFSDDSSADKDYIPDSHDNTSDENSNGNESNDEVKRVRISQDKSKPNSTGESTRFEDDKRTETESPHADDDYFSDDSSADKDYIPDSHDNTSDENFNGNESNDEVKRVRISQDKSKPNSTGESTRFEDDKRTETESQHADDDYFSDDSSADKDYIPDSHDNTSDENSNGNESNDEVKRVRISQDKSKPNSTGESTRFEDDKRTETEYQHADDDYFSDDSSADKDYIPDSHDNTSDENSDGGDSDVYPMLRKETISVVQKAIETNRKPVYLQSDDDDEDEDDDMKSEGDILRDTSKPSIYITRVLTSETTKTGRKKKSDRVYNSYQYCGSCKIKVSNLSQHLNRNKGNDHPHRKVPEIKAINEETNRTEKTKLQSLLRFKFNHEFNMRTKSRGKGEILLDRRPVSEFRLNDYGPCPNCLSWVAKKLLRKHQKSCVAKKEITESIGDLTTQSECLSGQLTTEASKKLIKEVFAKMLSDDVAHTVKNDLLIVQLGNQWIEKNVGNVLKRGVYTSQILRLVGRFLLNIQKITGLQDASLWDYLKPKYFETLVKASLLTACPLMDDEDNLKSPSNAIKLGYDIRRLINGKIGISIIKQDSQSQHEGEQMLKLMDIYWGTRVTKLARVLLEERRYYADKLLPLPEDIASLNKHIGESIATLDLTCTSKANFRRVAELIQAKLVIYNRRRTGELQAIRMSDYNRRCKGGDGIHLLGKCSDFEKKLLESQEVMTIRGKVGRPVPVIIPHETKRGLAYLTNSNIRCAAGVADTNEYVFASGGQPVTCWKGRKSPSCFFFRIKIGWENLETNALMTFSWKADCVAVLLSILRQMTEVHYVNYINTFNLPSDLGDFLMEIMMLFQNLINTSVFQEDWMEMIMLQNSIILRALRFFAQTINQKFSSPFEQQLWNNFFHCAISFLTQDFLQLENFSASKRNKIISRYNDMRREMGFEIRSMWSNLGQNKIYFVPEMVGPLLEMTLIPETELRKATIPIFFDMMMCEYNQAVTKGHVGNFKQVENEMINQLDVLIEGGRGDEQYMELFRDILSQSCKSHESIRDQGLAFVDTITKLLRRLLEYRHIIQDEIKDHRMSCIVNLLDFYNSINRQEMYVRYLHKLCTMHLECDNYTEAAHTLLLYAKLLDWTDEGLPTHLFSERFPEAQTHRGLKEMLYHHTIQYFEKGKMWERGIDLCKELAQMYENELFDYEKLSWILKRQAGLFECIMKEMRPDPEYFRVGYFGKGFPSFLQNKVLIYRGKEYERLQDFNSRMQILFPNAEFMKTLSAPSEDLKESQKQYLQVNAVTPVMDMHRKFLNKQVSEKILKYYNFNEVQLFTFSRRIDEGGSDITNIWQEKTNLTTKSPLPGILCWFEVTQTIVYKVSPIEYAIETMETTIKKLNSGIEHQMTDEKARVDQLGMLLNGIVDAAVNGGISNWKSFYSEEFPKNDKDNEFQKTLRDLTKQQSVLLRDALYIHKKKVSEQLKPFHAHMEQRFAELQQMIEKEYNLKVIDSRTSVNSTLRRFQSQSVISLDRISNMFPTSPSSPGPGGNTTSSIYATPVNPVNNPPPKPTQNRIQSVWVKPEKNIKSTLHTKVNRKTKRSSQISTASSSDSPDSNRNSLENPIELNEQLTPKRPLRPEPDRERRNSQQRLSAQFRMDHPTLPGVHSISTPSLPVSTPSFKSYTFSASLESLDIDSEEPPPPLPQKQSTTENNFNHIEPPPIPDRKASTNIPPKTPRKSKPLPSQSSITDNGEITSPSVPEKLTPYKPVVESEQL